MRTLPPLRLWDWTVSIGSETWMVSFESWSPMGQTNVSTFAMTKRLVAVSSLSANCTVSSDTTVTLLTAAMFAPDLKLCEFSFLGWWFTFFSINRTLFFLFVSEPLNLSIIDSGNGCTLNGWWYIHILTRNVYLRVRRIMNFGSFLGSTIFVSFLDLFTKLDGAACKYRPSKHKCLPFDGQLMKADVVSWQLSLSIHSPVKLFTRTCSAIKVGAAWSPPSVRYVTVDKCGCT